MSARTSKPVRRWTLAGATLVLVASVATIFVGSQPSDAYDASQTWTVSGQSASTATASGLTSTVTASDGVTISGHTPFSGTNNPASAQFTPNSSMATDALRLSVGAGCFAAGTCVSTGVHSGIGQLVVTFNQPVKDPSLHFEGIGAIASGATGMTAFHSTFTLDPADSGGARLGAVSSGATDLQVSGNTVETVAGFAGTSCSSPIDSEVTAAATAGCGSVQVEGTVTQLTFDVGVISEVETGAGSNSTSGDAVGLAVTFAQNYSAAPASYDLDGGAANGPRHLLGDLALGPGAQASSTDVLDPADSPSAVAAGSAIAVTSSSALPSWPALTTAMIGSTYAVAVPISGASRAGEVCGYIDFAHTGSFSVTSDEQACQAFAAGDRSVALAWTVPADTTAGLTYARLRAAYDPTQAQRATGAASSGEVEDYSLRIRPTVSVISTLPAGTAGSFDLAVNNVAVTPGRATGVSTDTDLTSGPAEVTVSESPAAGNNYSYAAGISCIDGLGEQVAAGTTMVQSVSIPKSGSGNGRAQNIVCTFANTGVAGLRADSTVNPKTVSTLGLPVGYQVTVTNTGPVPITSLDVTSKPGVSCPVNALAPGASIACTTSTAATEPDFDAGAVTFSATVTGTDPAGVPVTATSPATTVTFTQRGTLTLSGSADPRSIGAAGQQLTFHYTLTNNGTVTVDGLGLVTRLSAPATATPIARCAATTLAVGAATTCVATYTVRSADLSSSALLNTASARATEASGTTIRSNISTTTVSTAPLASVALATSAQPTTLSGTGQSITYALVVTNTGNLTLSPLSVKQTVGATSLHVACPLTTLAPTESTTCDSTYSTTQADVDAGSVASAATVSATTPTGSTVSSAPSKVKSAFDTAVALTLVHSASPVAIDHAGEMVTYSFTVTNTGAQTLSNVKVADSFTGRAGTTDDPAALSINCPATTLKPSATTTCRATYRATQADLDRGRLTDAATATATTKSGREVTAPPAMAVVTVTAAPGLRVVAAAAPGAISARDQAVEYTFAVANTGNLIITDVTLGDQFAGGRALATRCPGRSLAPGAAMTCTGSYVSTQTDISARSIKNTVTGAGHLPSGEPISSAPASVTVAAVAGPALEVTAVATPTVLHAAGQIVGYSFLVTNTGNASLSGVTVGAPSTGAAGSARPAVTCPVAPLAANASITCTASPYTSTQADVDAGLITISSVATGTAGATPVTSAPAWIQTAIDAPSGLRVVLSGQVNGSATIGDVVTIKAVVTNTGLTTIKSVALSGLPGATSCPHIPLAPSASVTCSVAPQTVTETESNTGQVTASVIATGASGARTVRSKPAVLAVAVSAPIPFTGVADLGPTLAAGGGALVAGIGLLIAAAPRRRHRRA